MKVKFAPTEVHMLNDLSSCLEEWEKVVPRPLHVGLMEEWKNEMKAYIAATYPEEDELVDSLTSGLLEAYSAWTAVASEATFSGAVDHALTFELMSRPQTAQRTANWYQEFQTRLTASEIFKAFGPARERAILIMQKAGKLEMPPRGKSLVVLKERLGPLDWGICFEPVVKQIIETEWQAIVHECGRFVHLTDERLAASPDGLLIQVKKKPEMAGHLLEIKCPKSRKIGVKLPMEYFYQMQLQMEVTGTRACEYVEVKFEMPDASAVKALLAPPAPLLPLQATRFGRIAVIGSFCEDMCAWNPSRYIYGPLGDLDWTPTSSLGLNEQTLELNTWVCVGIHHETVLRDKAWFAELTPKLDAFWADIEKAKRGEFTVPESSRKKKEVKCDIVDSDVEEVKIECQKVENQKVECQKVENQKVEDQITPDDEEISDSLRGDAAE